MTDSPPPVSLQLDLECDQRDAELFVALVIYLIEIEQDAATLPDPDLDDVMGKNAAALIAEITPGISAFGIESTYDPRDAILRIRDIAGKPDVSALSLILVWLYPRKLPIAFSTSSPVDPAKPIWTIVDHTGIVVTDNEHAVRTALRVCARKAITAARDTFH